MSSDCELLRQYVQQGDEAAFAEVVRRHADLVYSVARRVTANGAMAEDITQAVFTQLAQNARRLSQYETLVGWLHTTARHRSIDAIRGEERRRTREHEATVMQNNSASPELNWTEIGPLLDEAVSQLKETDRDAVLLRFFKNLSHQEVGAAIGLGEDAARKRIDRALDKLREYFERHGVKASSALLAVVLTENSVEAAPVGLAAQVTGPALASAGAATTGSLFLKILFMSTQTKLIITATIIIIAVAISLSWPPADQAPHLSGTAAVGASSAPAVTAKISAQVAQPVVPAVTPSTTSTNTATTAPLPAVVSATDPGQFVAGPQTDLNTAITTGLHFLETKDTVGFLKTLMPPALGQLNGDDPNGVDNFAAKISNQPGTAKKLASMMEALSALADLKPQESPVDNRATYHLDPPVGGHKVIIFNKVNGFWYLDGM